MALTVGSRLGHYHVTALIGEEGMGQVYQATDTKLNRQVALKILPEAFATDPDRLARFQREAQVLASLNHSNIGQIHGIEDSEGTKALVLELVEGPTLADRIAQGAIPVDEALPIAKQIAEALEAAHEAGVIHRDLKPANIKVKDDGTVKVLDFGLAKAFEPEAGSVSASMSPTISLTPAATQMGMVIGTAAYMAPEQAKGLTVDKRADIWAYGAVLFEILTGKKLFEAADVSEMLASVLIKDPNISSIGQHVPDHIRSVVRHCLVKDPKRRLRDIGDVRLAMEGTFETAVSAPADATALPQPEIWQRPVPLALAALGIAAIASLGGWSLTRSVPTGDPVMRFSIPLGPDQDFTRPGRHLVALTPDGSQLVYVANGGLHIRRLDQLQATPISGAQGDAFNPFISPDGEWIGFFQGEQLKKVAMGGGASVTLCDAVRPWGVSWSADDMILYGQGPEGIWMVPAVGGTPERMIEVQEGEQAHGPQMLPGGDWVLFTLRPAGANSWNEAQIVVQSLATEERIVLIERGRDARYVSTGHLVYGLNGVVMAVAFDHDARQVLGGSVPLVEGVATGPTLTGTVHFSVASNGSLAYVPDSMGVSGADQMLVWVDRDGEVEALPFEPRQYDAPRISPNGGRVAVQVRTQDNEDIYVLDLDQETDRRLTFAPETDAFPIWSRDGSRVAFHSEREGGGIFWKADDGSGQAEQLVVAAGRPSFWSSDGRSSWSRRTGARR